MELVGLSINSVVELKDGSLLANNGRISKDGGKTWSEPRLFGQGVGGEGLLRLKSGAIALTTASDGRVWFSRDEGKTWTGP